jgi:ABC-type amino acid transport substrate-binding protein
VNRSRTIVTALLSVSAVVVLALGVFALAGCNSSATATAKQETAFQRVLRTGEVRCSYIPYPPYCIKEPNTGKLSGVFVDVMEKIGEKLQLKVNWVEEVGWGTIFEGLGSGRHDVFAAGLWESSARAKTSANHCFSTEYVSGCVRTRGGSRRLMT